MEFEKLLPRLHILVRGEIQKIYFSVLEVL
jgi:hypothetical protein